MPFLHWATSGTHFKHRDSVIKDLAEQFKDPDYIRPTLEMINRAESASKMRVLRAFLHPARDSCLQIRRTLDQYYYSTVEEADQRTETQVVYKFAKKQHQRLMEEEKKAEARRKRKEKERLAQRTRAIQAETERKLHSHNGSSGSSIKFEVELEPEPEGNAEEPYKRKPEPPWDPPKVMMVNQLWMWIVDGGKVWWRDVLRANHSVS
jgi:hypothetical protein